MYSFQKGGLFEGLNTPDMQKRADNAAKIVNEEHGTNFSQEKARILAENTEKTKWRPKTKYGYNLEPWEQKASFMDKALQKGSSTAQANQMWAAQEKFIQDPNSEGAQDFNTSLDEAEDVDHQGAAFEEVEVAEADVEAEEGEGSDPPVEADGSVGEEGPAGPVGVLEEEPTAPEEDPLAAPPPGQGGMVQPEVQQSFRPVVQNEQDWMALKNNLSGAGAAETAEPGGIAARNRSHSAGIEARSTQHRESITNRNKQWANL